MMGIVSHDYRVFDFISGERPDAASGVLLLTVVPREPNHAYDNAVTKDQAVRRHGVIELLADKLVKRVQGIKLRINVDGRTGFPNGGYKICGLTEYDGKLHNVEIYVSGTSAEADYVKLTLHLPLITVKLPDAKIG